MSNENAKPPHFIKLAIESLRSIDTIQVKEKAKFVPEENAWAFAFYMNTSPSSEFIPARTQWVVLIDPSYPNGFIRIFPAAEEGVLFTFPHQDHNVLSNRSRASWRLGKLCLDSPIQRLGRCPTETEPKGDPEQRLLWHVQRCIGWVRAAVEDSLMDSSEPFEVPQCPNDLLDTTITVVSDEGVDTFNTWNGREKEFGLIRWGTLPGADKPTITGEFLDSNGKLLRKYRGNMSLSEEKPGGFWWLWPFPIVLDPWQTPRTWQEIRDIAGTQGMDVDVVFRWFADQLRKNELAILLLGYPIPTLWHGPAAEIHWQALRLPKLLKSASPPNGFRNNRRGRWEKVRNDILGNKRKLSYLKTKNWHPSRLHARGHFPETLRSKKIAVIGLGALGSSVAELLARGGVVHLGLIDYDNLEAGNLVRHMLTAADLGQNKAEALAFRLRLSALMSTIEAIPKALPFKVKETEEMLEGYDVILDCTAENEVLSSLGEAWWPIPRLFLSTSLGFAAERLFIYHASSCSFPFKDFIQQVRPWLDMERSKWSEAGETLEGAGCWSPLFPARCDDIWMAAIATVKHLEKVVSDGSSENGLLVLKQQNNECMGYKHSDLEGERSLCFG